MTEFAFDEGEVLEYNESGDICHVTHRWVDEDGDVLYAIHDKTIPAVGITVRRTLKTYLIGRAL